MTLNDLLPYAQKVADELTAHRHTIAVAESAAGGLISAALLALPGASAYCRGGAVLYTRAALASLTRIPEERFSTMRGATEDYAIFIARSIRQQYGTHWAIGESGAAGPTGNRYGDAPGHACLAVTGAVERTMTVETGSADRLANMHAFAQAALKLMAECLAAQRKKSQDKKPK